MSNKPTAEEVIQRVEAHKQKIRDIFGSGAGKEVLDFWLQNVANAKLFYDDERTTAYAIGQRDFILELSHTVKGE